MEMKVDRKGEEGDVMIRVEKRWSEEHGRSLKNKPPNFGISRKRPASFKVRPRSDLGQNNSICSRFCTKTNPNNSYNCHPTSTTTNNQPGFDFGRIEAKAGDKNSAKHRPFIELNYFQNFLSQIED